MNDPKLNDRPILSVSQLNRRAKQLLETQLALVWVSGEISNLAKPTSGHWYFSLKDAKAQVRCAMFKNANQRLRWSPEFGQHVSIRARVSLYEGRGEYQLIVEHMEAAGDGRLQQQYEQLKNKLNEEGLFAQEDKRALPIYPRHIGLVTSPTGAAIHDILSVLKRRYPSALVTLFPSSVQGTQAPQELINAVNQANNDSDCDVLIISRGGGSLEDLWAFNDEGLARAIHKATIPVVSAVGHEVDFTIADFVADVRAPTPSVSAEITTPDTTDIQQQLDHYQRQLERSYSQRISQEKNHLLSLQKRLRHPGQAIRQQQQRLSHYEQQLRSNVQGTINKKSEQINYLTKRLAQQHPTKLLPAKSKQLEQLSQLLEKSAKRLIEHKRQRFTKQAVLLDAMSPLTVLARGYSITRNLSHDCIVKEHKQVTIGDTLSTRLHGGHVISTVTQVTDKK
ncbi:exodeoxyribonuclease VII large subunit [Eionea flava]